MRNNSVLCLALLLFLTLSSCSSKQEDPGISGEEMGFNSNYKVIQVSNGGSIRGKLTAGDLDGVLQRVEIQRDQPVCGESHPNPAYPNVEGVQGAILWLEGIKEGKDFAFDQKPEMDQIDCAFIPHTLLIKPNSSIIVHNSDDALHNYHVNDGTVSVINEAQPEGAPPREIAFKKTGLHRVNCDVHPWMKGFVMVAKHPYYTISDSLGQFRIDNIPPGTYQLNVWRDNWNVEQLRNSSGKVISYKFSSDFTKQDSVTISSGSELVKDFTIE